MDAVYIVVRGFNPGWYTTWADCEREINGFDDSFFCKFTMKRWKTIAKMNRVASNFRIKAAINKAKTKKTYYAVAKGNATGIFFTEKHLQQQIKGASFVKYHKFHQLEAAADYINEYQLESQRSLQLKFPVHSDKKLIKNFLNFRKCFTRGFRIDDKNFIHVYTDGACSKNGRQGANAGIGVFFDLQHPSNRSLPVGPDFKNSNNVAELLAVKEALIRVTGSNGGPIKLVINTDSEYVIRCFMYSVKKWKAKGWMTSSGTPVENRAIIEEIDNIISSSGIVIKWNHVPAHSGFYGNEKADKLAKAGARKGIRRTPNRIQ